MAITKVEFYFFDHPRHNLKQMLLDIQSEYYAKIHKIVVLPEKESE